MTSRKFRLRTTLVVPFVVQIIGAVGLVGYFSYKNSQQAVNNLAYQLMDSASQRVNDRLDTYFALPQQINQWNAEAIAAGELNPQDARSMMKYFWRQAKIFTGLGYIGYARSNGTESGAGRWINGLDLLLFDNPPQGKAGEYRANPQGEPGQVIQRYDYDPRQQSWYQQTVQAGKPIWSGIFTLDVSNLQLTPEAKTLDQKSAASTLGASNYYIAAAARYPIYTANRQLVGILMTDLVLTEISQFLKHLQVSPAGQILIVERNGRVVASSSSFPVVHKVGDRVARFDTTTSPDPRLRAVAKAVQQQFGSLQAIQTKQYLDITFDQQRQFIQVRPWRDAHGLDWLLIFTVPESDFMAQINQNTRNTIALCFAALAVAIAIGICTAHWITRPIKHITTASEEMTAGQLEQHIQSSAIIELNQLANAFNSMAGQLKESLLQIVQSEKMSALGNLVAGVAHEINNPVGFIYGTVEQTIQSVDDIVIYLRLYQEKFPTPGDELTQKAEEFELEYQLEDLPKMLNSMKLACDRIREISTSLRTFSRADKDHKVAVDIHQGIDSTLLILKHRLKANQHRPTIEVIKNYSLLPEVHCFSGQLNQVFMNILANAIDVFDEAAEQASFEALQANPQTITIQTRLLNEEKSIQISIRDNGKGIPEEIKARIFDHLFTTKGVGKGTGLGLAIVRQIVVEKHGGHLGVESTLGQGAEFLIQLPLAE